MLRLNVVQLHGNPRTPIIPSPTKILTTAFWSCETNRPVHTPHFR